MLNFIFFEDFFGVSLGCWSVGVDFFVIFDGSVGVGEGFFRGVLC